MSEPQVYRAPTEGSRFEIREKGSRFLAIVEPIADVEAARARMKSLQRQYLEATHVCWAWRVGCPPVEGRSDAGEPNGTAGEPMLRVLRGAGLSDVLAVVVRWFGGVKLGKGGLARAYSGAVKGALETLPVIQKRPVTRLRVVLPLASVGDLKRLVHPPEVAVVEERYAEQAEVTLEVEQRLAGRLAESIAGFATEVEIAGA